MAAIGDRMIHKVTDEEFEKTLAPKVRGSLEIFATTQQEEWSLDFFLVLFLGACRAWHNYGQVALQRTEEALHGAADVAIKTKRIGRFGSLQDAVGPQSNEAKQKSTICSGGTYIRE